MKAKNKVIQDAYGEYYEKCKPDENGWSNEICDFFLDLNDNGEIDYWNFDVNNMWRPLTLKGIENNNGWIKIESEKDLPKKSLLFWVKLNSEGIKEFFHNKTSDGITYNRFMPNSEFYIEEWMKYVTHYQLAITPPKPLY